MTKAIDTNKLAPFTSALVQPNRAASRSSFGRMISNVGQVAWQVTKVSLVFALVFGLGFLQGVAATSCRNGLCDNTPASYFPPYAARHMNTGMQLTLDARHGCSVMTPVETPISCERGVNDSLTYFRSQGETDKTLYTKEGFQEKGTPSIGSYLGKPRNFNYGLNPQKYHNYKTATDYIEKEILQQAALSYSLPFQGTHNETLSHILKIHTLLTEKLPNAAEITPGKIRTTWAFVDGKNIDGEPHERAKKILNKSELVHYSTAMRKILTTNGDADFFSPIELAVCQKVHYVPPGPRKLPSELKKFSRELKVRLSEHVEPIELAAWVHTEFVRIHPFLDGNGRMARLLMNTILAWHRHPTLIFPDEKAYDTAVAESIQNPDDFLHFLRDKVIPWMRSQEAELKAVDQGIVA